MAYLEEIKGLLRESDRLLLRRLFLHRDKFTFTIKISQERKQIFVK